MEQHCDWIVHGTVGLRGKGCTRMRPKLHLPVLGHALRASGDKACSSFGRLRCGKHFYRSDQPKTADGRPPVGLTGTGPRVVQAEPAKAEPDAETVPLLARWVVLPSAYHPAL